MRSHRKGVLPSEDPSSTTPPGGHPGAPYPLFRRLLTTTNYPLPTTNSPDKKVRFQIDLTRLQALQLKDQAQRWAKMHVPTSGIRHRPPVLSGYLGYLVEQKGGTTPRPRAYTGRRSETRVKYARAVAPWTPKAHRYMGPVDARRADLALKWSLLEQFPKNGDREIRARSLDAAQQGIVKAFGENDILDPLSLSAADVSKVDWFRAADADRYAERLRALS